MNLKNKIISLLYNSYEKVTRHYGINVELKKFDDIRRKRIYEKIVLSDTQKHEIDNLYVNNLGRKIPYTWHRHYTAFTGSFDANYFPEFLFIPEFEHFMNYKIEFAKVLEDKNFLPLIAKSVRIKMPRTILSCTSGIFRDENLSICNLSDTVNILNNKGTLFAKPSINSCSGQGCRKIKIIEGIDEYSKLPLNEVLDFMGKIFVIQEEIKCHSSIFDIYPRSVNTFRIVTYRWKNEIRHMPIIMRIGQGGSYLDNAHAGGMFIAVEDEGTLHKTAFTEFKNKYDCHPDTNFIFEGHRIQGTSKVIEAAIKIHSAIPQIGCVNWDFTLDQNNDPILIEANVLGGSVWLIEMAHGKGAFGQDTAEVLRWIKKMESLPIEKWDQYAFGNNYN